MKLNETIIKEYAAIKQLTEVEPTNLDEEINRNLAIAKSNILFEEVAREYVNRNLHTMPVVTTRVYITQYNDRDDVVNKEQSVSLSLWVVALVQTIRNGYVSKAALTTAFINWCKEETKINWDKDAAGRTAMQYIREMVSLGIINKDLEPIEYRENGQIIETRAATLTESFIKQRDALIRSMWDSVEAKCRPLEFKPRPWTSKYNGVHENANMPLIKRGGREIEVSDKVLEAVNKLQEVKYVCHPEIVQCCYDYIDNEEYFSPKKTEMSEDAYRTAKAAYDDHIRMCEAIVELEGKEFYFPVTMDKRGRMYYRGGLVSPQGTDLCKAAFQFADKKRLGDNGYHALMITMANAFGCDKLSIELRANHAAAILATELTDVEHLAREYPKADKFQAWVAYCEVQKVIAFIDAGGDFRDFESNLVCHQDGTCNGLQHMAAITRDLATARTVNCTASSEFDEPLDIYGIVADTASEIAHGVASNLIKQYGRKMAKGPVMVTGYGAGETTVARGIREFLVSNGEPGELSNEIARAYCEAMNSTAGAVKTFTKAINRLVDKARSCGNTLGGLQWDTVDGMRCHVEYLDEEAQRIRGIKYNAKCEGLGKAVEDEVKTVYAAAPNFIHSVDAAHLRGVVRECDWQIAAVHDSIGTHAGTYQATAEIIRSQFVETHNFDALAKLCEFLDVRKPNFRGEYDVKEALNSTYLFS